jgi:hypothetical protein
MGLFYGMSFREGPTFHSVSIGRTESPMMMASSGCFFAHVSYSPRTACLASSFFMLAMRTSSRCRHVAHTNNTPQADSLSLPLLVGGQRDGRLLGQSRAERAEPRSSLRCRAATRLQQSHEDSRLKTSLHSMASQRQSEWNEKGLILCQRRR